jgi:hypothetical protein
MFLGVMARDAGDRERRSIICGRRTRWRRRSPIPALELALHAGGPPCKRGRQVYDEILKRDPTSRPAMLGLARVARSQQPPRRCARALPAAARGQPEGPRRAERHGLAGARRSQSRAGEERLRVRADARPRTTRKPRRPVQGARRLPLSARRQWR